MAAGKEGEFGCLDFAEFYGIENEPVAALAVEFLKGLELEPESD